MARVCGAWVCGVWVCGCVGVWGVSVWGVGLGAGAQGWCVANVRDGSVAVVASEPSHAAAG